MRRYRILGLASVLGAFICAGGWVSLKAAAQDDTWIDYDNYEVIDTSRTWSGTHVQADVTKPIVVVNGSVLTINAGTRVEIGTLYVLDGRIVADGTEESPIVFTKMQPDLSLIPKEYAGYDRECFPYAYPDGTIEFADWVESETESSSIFRNVIFEKMGSSMYHDADSCPVFTRHHGPFPFINTAYAAEPIVKSSPALRFFSGQLSIERSKFVGSAVDVEAELQFYYGEESYDSLVISDSDFHGVAPGMAVLSNFQYPDGSSASSYLDHLQLINNWYGHESGPTALENPGGAGKALSGSYRLEGWSATEFGLPTACADCASNVLFLPGIKASRLYKDGALGTEDQLWLPTIGSDDTEELAMDGDGGSIEDVYTRDVLDEVGLPIIGGNIYKSFLDQLKDLKSGGTINDYQTFAYDWRENVEDVVREGTLYPDDVIKSVVHEIATLAGGSKSAKVTIVAHSNGGLLAKALMMELEAGGKADLVDRVVFVGTPQMGTPLAILSMLYGYDEPIPALLSQSEARELAENMPGVDGLLPSEKYLDRAEEPFVAFSSDRTRYKDFKDAYGDAIDSYGEFKSFLSGEGDGRSEPDAEETELENTLREKFLNQAEATHERLDNWIPPEGVEVIQIAGWGLDTVSGVEYMEKEKTRCYSVSGKVPSCIGIGEYELYYDPKLTVDGDAVVVAPSALLMPEAENVKRYWVDLYRSNTFFRTGRQHKDLLEFDSIKEIIGNVITKNDEESLPQFIRTSRFDDYENAKPRLRMSLYSPLDIHLYDDQGNHTGSKKEVIDGREVTVIEEGIPNSYYYQFGDRKYVGFGSGGHIRVAMDGYNTGSYTLKLEEVKPTESGEETIAHTTFANLPVTSETEVTLDVPETGINDLSTLEADINGDEEGGGSMRSCRFQMERRRS